MDNLRIRRRKLRDRLRFSRKQSVPARYSETLQRDVASYCQAARSEGVSWDKLSEDLVLTTHTLQRWIRESKSNKPTTPKPPTFIECGVPVSLAGAASGAVLISPQGWRIEGLSVEDVLKVLRGMP